jgi:hypothetical protein
MGSAEWSVKFNNYEVIIVTRTNGCIDIEPIIISGESFADVEQKINEQYPDAEIKSIYKRRN